MVDPQGRINRLRKMLVRRTSLTGPVCGTQYCPVKKTPYVLITIFLLILHHYLKSTKTYLNKGNRGTRGTRETRGTVDHGGDGNRRIWAQGNKENKTTAYFYFQFLRRQFPSGGESIKACVSKYPALQKLDVMTPSSETQGQIVGARESLNRRKNKARRKVKNGGKSPWGQCLTRPVPNGGRRSGL